MRYEREYIVQCGYYPDLFAGNDLPIDLFFTHVTLTEDLVRDCEDDAGLGAARHRYMLILAKEVAQGIIDAIKDKYRLDMGGPYSRPFNIQDCFWSCSPRPTEYAGADDEYPVNAS